MIENEMQYWNRMVEIRYAELAVQQGMLNALQALAMKQGAGTGGVMWDDTKRTLDNAKAVIKAWPQE